MRQSAINMQSELTAEEMAGLKSFLSSAGLTGTHLEIGTAAGGTLKEMMLCYGRPRPRFVAIDTFAYFPRQREIVETNLTSAGIDLAEAELRAMPSETALRAATESGEQFAFIFIDANHQARHVIRDLRWARLLAVNGALCLHDYGPKFPGVVWAVERFLRNNRNYRRVGLAGSIITLQKTAQSPGGEVSSVDLFFGDVLSQIHRLRRSIQKRLGRLG